LTNEQTNQFLELSAQKLTTDQQNQKIELLEKERELQDLQLQKKKRDIEELKKTEEQHRRIKTSNTVIIALLFLLLVGMIWLMVYRNTKKKALLSRNEIISRMNQEITAQNNQLIDINDQLQIKSIELQAQNNKLNAAQGIINRQNGELLTYTRDLEDEVMRRTEQIRENSQRLTENADQLEKFTYAVSHNLRAPIARLLGLADIISSSMPPDEQLFFLSKVKESAHQLDDVIKDLNLILELKAEKNTGFESIDLDARINGAIALHADLIKQVSAEIVVDLQVKHVAAIGPFIDSILYNLIGNALKFSDPLRHTIIQLKSFREKSLLVFTCQDNGVGIDLQKHGDKLFGLYKRFEPKVDGKGLGLYLVKSHVQMLGGTVSVQSTLGKGTTFTIQLPLNATVTAPERLSENALS
jgi:two-component system, sensor histidine kinase LadS